MKFYRVARASEEDQFIEEVDGRTAKYCKSAYIIKDGYMYFLIDKSTGLAITRSFKLHVLEDEYLKIKDYYESYCKTDKYHIKVEHFNKLVSMYIYGKENKQWSIHYKLS